MAPAGRDAVKLSDTAGRRTTPSVPAHCAARPFVSHRPAAGLAGRPIPAPGRVSQAQTRLSGTQSAPTIDASLGLRGLNFRNPCQLDDQRPVREGRRQAGVLRLFSPSGETLGLCSIIVAAANVLTPPIHDLMPVLPGREDADRASALAGKESKKR